METYKLTITTKSLVILLLIMFPVGIVIMLPGILSSKYLWTTNIFLGLQALITILMLKNAAKHRSVVFITAVIFIFSFLIELIGVKTGIPFGSYAYTQTLNPSIIDVPVAILFAWFVLSVNSYWLSRHLLKQSRAIFILLLSSIFILAADMLLEPFASLINGYWIWESGRIPVYNYAGWFIIGFFFSYLLDKYVVWNKGVFYSYKFAALPVIILTVNIIQFSVVNVVHGFVLITVTGLLTIGTAVLIAYKFKPNEV